MDIIHIVDQFLSFTLCMSFQNVTVYNDALLYLLYAKRSFHDTLPCRGAGTDFKRIIKYCSILKPCPGSQDTDLSRQFSSVAQFCPTVCDPINHSTPGFPVHHQLPEFTQTHVHRVGDAIQPFHPLSSPSPPAPNPSQHQGLFQ